MTQSDGILLLGHPVFRRERCKTDHETRNTLRIHKRRLLNVVSIVLIGIYSAEGVENRTRNKTEPILIYGLIYCYLLLIALCILNNRMMFVTLKKLYC